MLNYKTATIISGNEENPIKTELNKKFILNGNKSITEINSGFKNLINPLSDDTYIATQLTAEFDTRDFENIKVVKEPIDESTIININETSSQKYSFKIIDPGNVVTVVIPSYRDISSGLKNMFLSTTYTSGAIMFPRYPEYNTTTKIFKMWIDVINPPLVAVNNRTVVTLRLDLYTNGNFTGRNFVKNFFQDFFLQ